MTAPPDETAAEAAACFVATGGRAGALERPPSGWALGAVGRGRGELTRNPNSEPCHA